MTDIQTTLGAIQSDVSAFVEQAKTIAITTPDTMATASQYLTGIKKRFKRIDEIRKEITSPLKDQVKKIDAMFNEQLEPLELVEGIIKKEMVRYQTEQEQIAQAEIAKQRKAAEEEQKKAQDEAKKKGMEAPVFVPKPIMVEQPANNVKTAGGATNFRKVWTFEITNPELIPREFLIPNEKLIRSSIVAAQGNIQIAGVRAFQETSVAVSNK